jgi:uncharacterized protein (TIGR03066 family)
MLRCIALLLCAVCALPFFFSCSDEKAVLVGRWETQIEDEEIGKFSMVYHFTEEGKIFLEQKKGAEIPFSIPFGTYQVEGDRVVVQSDGKEISFTFSVSENQMTFLDSSKNEVVFKRIDAEEK